MDAEYLEFKTSLYRTNARQTLSREVLTSDFFYSASPKFIKVVLNYLWYIYCSEINLKLKT